MRQEDANRERLVQFLRDEDAQRHERFTWHFGSLGKRNNVCGTVGCAVGAADQLGLLGKTDWPHSAAVCSVIGLPNEAHLIFLIPTIYGVDDMDDVTASMVADKIEQVAAEGWAG